MALEVYLKNWSGLRLPVLINRAEKLQRKNKLKVRDGAVVGFIGDWSRLRI